MTKIFDKTTKQLLIHIAFLSICFILIFLPIFKQISISPQNTYYTYVHGLMPDYYGYLMVIRQGRTQNFEINQFSTENAPPARQHLFYLVLGKIASHLQINDIQIYYLSIGMSFILFYFFSYLIARTIVGEKYSILARYFMFFTSPPTAGTLSLVGITLPIENAVWWTWMSPYTRLIVVPHHFFSLALMLGSLFFFLLFYRNPTKNRLIPCISLNIISTIFFPIPSFILTISIAIIGIGKIILSIKQKTIKQNKKILVGIGTILLVNLLSNLYVYTQISSGYPWNKFVEIEYETYKQERGDTTFLVYLFSLGILPLLGVFAIPKIMKDKKLEYIFPLLMIMVPMILYNLAVFGFIKISKLRFAYSAPYVFLGILATTGVIYLLSKIKNEKTRILTIIFLVICFSINTILGFKTYWLQKAFEVKIYRNTYIPKDDLLIFDFLQKNTSPYSNIMTMYGNGVVMVAFTHNKVYVAHELATLNFWEKYHNSEKFYGNAMIKTEVEKIFKENNISYVYWDHLSYGEPKKEYLDILVPIYKINSNTIYKTNI